MSPKVVILDFDDTLFMTEEASFEIENETARRLGYPPMARTAHIANWGSPLEHAITERIPGISADAFMQTMPSVLHQYVITGRIDQLTNSNLTALQQLRAKGYRLYAVTSRTAIEVEHLLQSHHPLSRYLKSADIFHKDNSPYHKPDPRAFDGVLDASGELPHHCLYVGDTPSDCQAAKSAGLLFVACLESGLRHRTDFATQTAPPDGYIHKFADLPDWLAAKNR